jgi:hypothetical protein
MTCRTQESKHKFAIAIIAYAGAYIQQPTADGECNPRIVDLLVQPGHISCQSQRITTNQEDKAYTEIWSLRP